MRPLNSDHFRRGEGSRVDAAAMFHRSGRFASGGWFGHGGMGGGEGRWGGWEGYAAGNAYLRDTIII
jgi:hypothetical protein